LASKKLEEKIEYQRNATLAERDVRRKHRASWDKFLKYLGNLISYKKIMGH
jgi:hypothetical protein